MIFALLIFAAALAGSTTPGEGGAAAPRVTTRSVSTAAFSLTEPKLHISDKGSKVSGAVCRRANYAMMSPSRVEIDRLAIDGTVTEKIFTFLPPLSRRIDQSCGHYAASFAAPLAPQETILVCIARVGRTCRVLK